MHRSACQQSVHPKKTLQYGTRALIRKSPPVLRLPLLAPSTVLNATLVTLWTGLRTFFPNSIRYSSTVLYRYWHRLRQQIYQATRMRYKEWRWRLLLHQRSPTDKNLSHRWLHFPPKYRSVLVNHLGPGSFKLGGSKISSLPCGHVVAIRCPSLVFSSFFEAACREYRQPDYSSARLVKFFC